ncbi:MAG: FtsH protease activity modulator HflK, partial [Calditrichaeota bacterium]|nr:FtsH protease activity modulator HflK [Calditrichota bacterium]
MSFPKKKINIGGEIFEVPDISAIFGRGIWGIVIVVGVIWLLTGFYIVSADQQGVVKRFGKFVRIAGPGIHFHLPFPIEAVLKPRVTEVKRSEVGFRTIDSGPPARYTDRPLESLMLTGNLNIIDVNLIVQYRILDPIKYLFMVRDVKNTVHRATEAALRQVIGKHDIDEALTTGKGVIQETAKEQLQGILDDYDSGIIIVQVQLQDVHPPQAVVNAFKDVASAKEDREKMIKQAEGYEADVIPRTRGKQAKMITEAQAWSAERIAKAEGDAENF